MRFFMYGILTTIQCDNSLMTQSFVAYIDAICIVYISYDIQYNFTLNYPIIISELADDYCADLSIL